MEDKIVAVICEYNPMHTGHMNLINQVKQKSDCKYVVGLMSGNFNQRSQPCILDKYTRAKIACENGMDLVLNLPTTFCTNNAEIFALSSIKILNQFCIDYLAFGVETLNEKAFFSLAKFLNNEPRFFKNELKKNLKLGLSYNESLKKTLTENISLFENEIREDIINILTKPNNILALEYIKALYKTKSKITPIFIKRVDNYNNENHVVENYVSSTFLRKKIEENNCDNINKYLPKNTLNLLQNSKLNYKLFHDLILFNIKTKNSKELKQIYAVNEGFENLLLKEVSKTNDYDVFYKNISTKRYKSNKINAVLLNSVLGINKKLISKIYTIKSNIIVKILAINHKNSSVLSKFNNKLTITRKSDINKIRYNKFNKKLNEVENKANCLYNLIANTHLFENDLYNKMQ